MLQQAEEYNIKEGPHKLLCSPAEIGHARESAVFESLCNKDINQPQGSILCLTKSSMLCTVLLRVQHAAGHEHQHMHKTTMAVLKPDAGLQTQVQSLHSNQ